MGPDRRSPPGAPALVRPAGLRLASSVLALVLGTVALLVIGCSPVPYRVDYGLIVTEAPSGGDPRTFESEGLRVHVTSARVGLWLEFENRSSVSIALDLRRAHLAWVGSEDGAEIPEIGGTPLVLGCPDLGGDSLPLGRGKSATVFLAPRADDPARREATPADLRSLLRRDPLVLESPEEPEGPNSPRAAWLWDPENERALPELTRGVGRLWPTDCPPDRDGRRDLATAIGGSGVLRFDIEGTDRARTIEIPLRLDRIVLSRLTERKRFLEVGRDRRKIIRDRVLEARWIWFAEDRAWRPVAVPANNPDRRPQRYRVSDRISPRPLDALVEPDLPARTDGRAPSLSHRGSR